MGGFCYLSARVSVSLADAYEIIRQDDCAVLKGEALSVGAVLLIGIVGLGLLAAAVFALL